MRKILITLSLLTLMGCSGPLENLTPVPNPVPSGTTVRFGLVNNSSHLSTSDVTKAVEAFNGRSGDLKSDWGVTIIWVVGAGDKTCTLQDGTAGYNGPFNNPESWRDSHYQWATVNVPASVTWQASVTGECECCALQRDVHAPVMPYAYPIDGIGGTGPSWIADYVLPNWFSGATPSPWDKQGKITGGPGSLAPGGLPLGT